MLPTSMKAALLLVLLAMITSRVTGAGCGGDLTNKNGTFSWKTTPGNTTCTWYIVADKNSQVLIQFNSLVLGSSNLTVIAGNQTESPQIVKFTKHSGTVNVISHAEITSVVFTQGDGDTGASFDAAFNSESCTIKMAGNQGVINSPVYRPNSGAIKCTYDLNLGNNEDVPVLSFLNWNWTAVTLNVSFDGGNGSAVGSSDDILGKAGTKAVSLSVQIKDGPLQQFQTVYQTASKECSGVFETDASGAVRTLQLPKDNALPIQCYAQIVSKSSKQIYVSTSGTGSSVAGGDSVLLLDGASQRANVIGSLNGGVPWLVSSASKVTLIANLGTKTARQNVLSYKEDAFSKLYVLTDTQKSVDISLNASKVNNNTVYVQVQSDTMVKIDFPAGSSLASTNASVTVQDNKATTLFVFNKDTVMFPVNSPAGGALIVVTGLTGTSKLQMTVSQSSSSDCNQLYQGTAGQISSTLNENATAGCVTVVSTGEATSSTILQLGSLVLCPNTTIEFYEGTGPNAAKLGTINSAITGSILPEIEFAAGSQPRLVWSKMDTSCKKQSLTAKYWSTTDVCGVFGGGLSGEIETPNYPNQYPLNSLCSWPLQAQNNSLLYISASSVQFGEQHSITVIKNKVKQLTKFSGSPASLPDDQIFPNDKLAMVFSSKTNNSNNLDKPGQGAYLSYKVLSCGGGLKDSKGNISNPNVTTPVECIWIIQMPAKGANGSVNIVSANISVNGYNQSSNTKLEIRDGGSVRANLLSMDLSKPKIPAILSRYNTLWIRFVSTAASDAVKSFNFSLAFSIYNCKNSSLCDNGVCLHPEWRCDGINQCGDGTDERNCGKPQPTSPVPPTTAAPHKDDKKGGGVPAYSVVICLLVGILIGVVVMLIIPKIMRRARLRNYHSFNNTENA